MAIQRADQNPLPDFRLDEPLDGIAKGDWAQTFPALKIHSTGRLSVFINYSKPLSSNNLIIEPFELEF